MLCVCWSQRSVCCWRVEGTLALQTAPRNKHTATAIIGYLLRGIAWRNQCSPVDLPTTHTTNIHFSGKSEQLHIDSSKLYLETEHPNSVQNVCDCLFRGTGWRKSSLFQIYLESHSDKNTQVTSAVLALSSSSSR